MKPTSIKSNLPILNISNLNIATNISPIDGRYQRQVAKLHSFCSEAAFTFYRVFVEIEWLKKIIEITNNHNYKKRKRSQSPTNHTQSIQNFLTAIVANFSATDITRIKKIEQETNHDVKAIEYFIKEKIATNTAIKPYGELTHIGCTSEDVNNLAYALMIKETRDQCLAPQLNQIIKYLTKLAHAHAATPMIARTHGQPATPTTVGKECANFVTRLQHQCNRLVNITIKGKLNGATGNYNALYIAYPEHDWITLTEEFVTALGITCNSYTTQIEPHDYIVDFCHTLAHINNILLDLCRDVWSYIALNYFTLKSKSSNAQNKETGSSTMPHKINPIDFENAEGNLGIANALLYHFATKLPISRWQRDLSDSTVLRNLGTSFAHSLIAYNALLQGLNKLEVNQALLHTELDQHWEVLGEAIQTVMRRYGIDHPYEKLKVLTRGRTVNAKTLQQFIIDLDLPPNAKKTLLTLTPHNYLGKAVELAKSV